MPLDAEWEEIQTLRVVVEEHRSQILALMRSDGFMVQAQSTLREQVGDLHMEFRALCDCLKSRGVLDSKELSARLRAGRGPRGFFRVLDEPQAAILLVHCMGLREAFGLCAASSACAENLPGALVMARTMVPTGIPEAMSCFVSLLHSIRKVREKCLDCREQVALLRSASYPGHGWLGATSGSFGELAAGCGAASRLPTSPEASVCVEPGLPLAEACEEQDGPDVSSDMAGRDIMGLIRMLQSEGGEGEQAWQEEAAAPKALAMLANSPSDEQGPCCEGGQDLPGDAGEELPGGVGGGRELPRGGGQEPPGGSAGQEPPGGSAGQEQEPPRAGALLPAPPPPSPPPSPAGSAREPRLQLGPSNQCLLAERRSRAGRPGAGEELEPLPLSDGGQLVVGSLVTLRGLTKRSDLNGQRGRLVEPSDPETGRCLVITQSGEAVRVEASKVQSEGEPAGRGELPLTQERPTAEEDDPGGKLFVCGGLSTKGASNCLEFFDNGTWTPLPCMAQARCAPGLAVVDNRLYIVGGEDHVSHVGRDEASKEACGPCAEPLLATCFGSTEVFDPAVGEWEPGPAMLEARAMPIVVAIGRAIYAVGGRGLHSSDALVSAECLEPGAKAWRQLPPSRHGRLLPSFGVLKGKLYICGGATGCWKGLPQSFAECFDPATERWTELPNMSRSRLLAGSTEMGDCLYICGGMNQSAESMRVVERFNSNSGCWESLPMMCRSRAGASVAAVTVSGLDTLFVCGGHDSNHDKQHAFGPMVPAVESLTPARGSWQVISIMPFPRSLGLTVVNGKHIYIVGGTDSLATVDTTVRYNVATGLWDVLEAMVTPRFKAVGAVLQY